MADHDALYHRLFSHPGMVAQLLREFLAGPWVDGLDLDAMERVNTKFHGLSIGEQDYLDGFPGSARVGTP